MDDLRSRADAIYHLVHFRHNANQVVYRNSVSNLMGKNGEFVGMLTGYATERRDRALFLYRILNFPILRRFGKKYLEQAEVWDAVREECTRIWKLDLQEKANRHG